MKRKNFNIIHPPAVLSIYPSRNGFFEPVVLNFQWLSPYSRQRLGFKYHGTGFHRMEPNSLHCFVERWSTPVQDCHQRPCLPENSHFRCYDWGDAGTNQQIELFDDRRQGKSDDREWGRCKDQALVEGGKNSRWMVSFNSVALRCC